MSKDWCRLYHEFATDPKVQSMSEAEQRRLIMLFCYKTNETLQTLHVTDLCYALKISPEELAVTKELFIRKGFIDEYWHIVNWDKRQYASNPSAERVRKFRERKRNGDVTPDSVTETLHVTGETPQSRAEAEQSQKESKKARSEIVDRACTPPISVAEGLDLNDFACACAVLAELLGKKQLARQDQETVGFWCSTYDMRGEALPLIGKKFKQYFEKNGEPPKSLKYFNSMLAEGCKNKPPYVEIGAKMRVS